MPPVFAGWAVTSGPGVGLLPRFAQDVMWSQAIT